MRRGKREIVRERGGRRRGGRRGGRGGRGRGGRKGNYFIISNCL